MSSSPRGKRTTRRWAGATEAPLPEERPEPEVWDAEWVAGLFPEVLGYLSRLTREAAVGTAAVDTAGFDAAVWEVQAANERQDTPPLREAAERARAEARRAVERAAGGG